MARQPSHGSRSIGACVLCNQEMRRSAVRCALANDETEGWNSSHWLASPGCEVGHRHHRCVRRVEDVVEHAELALVETNRGSSGPHAGPAGPHDLEGWVAGVPDRDGAVDAEAFEAEILHEPGKAVTKIGVHHPSSCRARKDLVEGGGCTVRLTRSAERETTGRSPAARVVRRAPGPPSSARAQCVDQ